MSLQAMVWALEQPIGDAHAKLVLLALANEANRAGESAYPSQQTIADTVPCGIATVQRKLRDLEDHGYVVRGDQQLVSHFPSNRRPVVWNPPLAHHSDVAKRGQAHQTGPVRPITGPSPVMDNPTYPRDNPGGRFARGESSDGATLGCASHRDRRRPACDACQRVLPPSKDRVKPSTPPDVEALKTALRGSR